LHRSSQFPITNLLSVQDVEEAVVAEGCSSNTGAYCKARARLPEGVLARLTRSKARRLENNSPRDWRWHGKRVRTADGTTASMPDTGANQRAYPQIRAQKPGVGFPLMRIVVIFS